ncbi:CYTH domain-containing protein [Gemmatimonadota bacterium]
MAEVERETKLALSPEDYGHLLGAGRVLGCTEQLNVYFHDPARLGESEGYLRVRYSSGKEPVATLKIPLGWSGDLREMLEIERPLRDMGQALHPRPRRRLMVATDLPEEFGSHFTARGITELERLGWMRNLRCLVDLSVGGIFEVDRTLLPNGEVVFEAEIEAEEETAHRALVARIREFAPSARPSRLGKFSRFLAARADRP